jgi:outer membrane protein assembly factor BamB
MAPRSRRALLTLLGSGSLALLTGCQTDSATEATTMSRTETTTATATETETDTETTTQTTDVVDCAPVSRPEAAWPVSRRSPARDGYVTDPQGFEAVPTIAWEAEPSVHNREHASPSYDQPVVADDTVYLTNQLEQGPEVPIYGHVHALEIGSGHRRWTSEELRSPSVPAVWRDRVAIVAENESLDAMVISFAPSDGTRQWTREFEALASGFVTAGDHLYLALEEDSDLGTIRALADDGSPVWSRKSALDDHVNQGPTVGTDNVYVTTRRGRLYALARSDGRIDWTHRFEHPTEPRPFVTDLVATDCAVFAVVEGAIKAFDDGGTPIWEVGGNHGSLTTDGDTIYTTVDSDGDGNFRALDAATGETQWTVGGPYILYVPPIIAGDAVYLGTDDSIIALDREDGTERWRRNGNLDNLALANGTLYGTTDGTLLALQ